MRFITYILFLSLSVAAFADNFNVKFDKAEFSKAKEPGQALVKISGLIAGVSARVKIEIAPGIVGADRHNNVSILNKADLIDEVETQSNAKGEFHFAIKIPENLDIQLPLLFTRFDNGETEKDVLTLDAQAQTIGILPDPEVNVIHASGRVETVSWPVETKMFWAPSGRDADAPSETPQAKVLLTVPSADLISADRAYANSFPERFARPAGDGRVTYWIREVKNSYIFPALYRKSKATKAESVNIVIFPKNRTKTLIFHASCKSAGIGLGATDELAGPQYLATYCRVTPEGVTLFLMPSPGIQVSNESVVPEASTDRWSRYTIKVPDIGWSDRNELGRFTVVDPFDKLPLRFSITYVPPTRERRWVVAAGAMVRAFNVSQSSPFGSSHVSSVIMGARASASYYMTNRTLMSAAIAVAQGQGELPTGSSVPFSDFEYELKMSHLFSQNWNQAFALSAEMKIWGEHSPFFTREASSNVDFNVGSMNGVALGLSSLLFRTRRLRGSIDLGPRAAFIDGSGIESTPMSIGGCLNFQMTEEFTPRFAGALELEGHYDTYSFSATDNFANTSAESRVTETSATVLVGVQYQF